jgi:phage gp29-like protein
VIVQTLAINEGKHASRAQAAVHQDVLGTILIEYKRWVCRMIDRDILTPLVAYNFPDAAHLVPRSSLGEIEPNDVNAMLTALATAGYMISPSQLPELDTMAGMPARSDDDLRQLQERAAQPSVMTQPGGDVPATKDAGGDA